MKYTVVSVEDNCDVVRYIEANSVGEAKDKVLRLMDSVELSDAPKTKTIRISAVFEGEQKDVADNPSLESGAAKIVVTLSHGHLYVHHGYTSDMLWEGELPQGGWNELLCSIKSATMEGRGILGS